MRLDSKLKPTLLIALLVCVVCAFSGCAERGTQRPIIHNVVSIAPHPTTDILRIGTANLWGVAVLGFDWSDAIDERFAAMASRLSENAFEFDVVLIQEAWKDSARLALLNQVGVEHNFPHRVDSVEQPGGGGLVVLSRYPIESAQFYRFEAQGNCFKFWEGDCLSGKGLLLVQIRVQGRSFWIADTHLIACYVDDETTETVCDQEDPNGRDRERQIVEARQIIEHRVGDAPVILGGDLNFTRTSRYYALMAAPTIAAHGTEIERSMQDELVARAWIEPGEENRTPERLDYLWSRPGLHFKWHPIRTVRPVFTEPVRLRSGRSVALSDHPILMGEFCLVRVDDPANDCLDLGSEAR